MNAIVSVTADWGIGLKGHLLVRNRADMRFFRETTMGGTVVCGRTTFESFPGGALKGRRNVVLTHDRTWSSTGAEVAHDLEEALELVADDDPERVWLIGGESVYRTLLERCSRAYVTMHDVVREADAHFPDLNASLTWELERYLGTGMTDEGVPYDFVLYRHLREPQHAVSVRESALSLKDKTFDKRAHLLGSHSATVVEPTSHDP